MKKLLLPIFLLFTMFTAFAQDEEQSAEFKWGERNAIWVILGLIVVIIGVIVWIRRRRKKMP